MPISTLEHSSTNQPSLLRRLARWLTDRLEALYGWRLDVVHVTQPTPGAPRQRYLAVFAHFDPDGRVDPYVVRYIQSLKRALPIDVVFVSTAPGLSIGALDELTGLCRWLLLRRNVALDFGSWNTAIHQLGWGELEGYEGLLLLNDSVYGPFGPLGDIAIQLEQAALSGAPMVVGLTDSEEIAPHLQSYFLWFNKATVMHPSFRRFWDRFIYHRSKHQIIVRCEVGLSHTLMEAGIECRPIFDTRTTLGREFGRNPTQFYWKRLITEMRFPFLKADILKRNPCGLTDTREALPLIRDVFSYDPELIIRHVRRTGNDRWL